MPLSKAKPKAPEKKAPVTVTAQPTEKPLDLLTDPIGYAFKEAHSLLMGEPFEGPKAPAAVDLEDVEVEAEVTETPNARTAEQSAAPGSITLNFGDLFRGAAVGSAAGTEAPKPKRRPKAAPVTEAEADAEDADDDSGE